MAIQRIQSVYTVVADMDAMQAFYSAALGIQPKFRDAGRWTQFSIGNTSFALSCLAEAAPGATGSVVVFESDCIAGIREAVEQAGGSFVAERDMGAHGQVISCEDPEGRPFQVFAKSPSTTQPSASAAKEPS